MTDISLGVVHRPFVLGYAQFHTGYSESAFCRFPPADHLHQFLPTNDAPRRYSPRARGGSRTALQSVLMADFHLIRYRRRSPMELSHGRLGLRLLVLPDWVTTERHRCRSDGRKRDSNVPLHPGVLQLCGHLYKHGSCIDEHC